MQYDLTTSNIPKSLILFSLPMILGNMLQQIYNIADTLIVSKTIGPAALSAVGSSYALMVLLTSIILGLCMGSSVVFAQLYGANKISDMKTSIFNAFVFILFISVMINIFAYLFIDPFIHWLNIPKEAIAFTHQYLKIIFSGIIFVFIYNFFAAILRSIGNTFVPLIFLALSALTNIVLDLIFICWFNMGVSGAALATVIAQILSAISITIYFFRKARPFCPHKSHMHYNKYLLGMVISNSILTAIQQSIMNLGILLVQGLVNSFGFAASAAFAVVVKIDAFAYMPAQDFGNAFATFVAQNYGATKTQRIHDGFLTAIKISSLFCLIASIGVYMFARPLMLIFVNPEEVDVIRIGIEYLRIEGVFYVGIGILFLLYGFYRGIGKSTVSIILTVISLGSRVILAYILSSLPSIGLFGIWWAVPIGWGLADFFGIWYYRMQKRP